MSKISCSHPNTEYIFASHPNTDDHDTAKPVRLTHTVLLGYRLIGGDIMAEERVLNDSKLLLWCFYIELGHNNEKEKNIDMNQGQRKK